MQHTSGSTGNSSTSTSSSCAENKKEKTTCNPPLTFHVLHKSHREDVGQPQVVWVAMAFTSVHPNISMHILHTVLNIFSCSTDMGNLF